MRYPRNQHPNDAPQDTKGSGISGLDAADLDDEDLRVVLDPLQDDNSHGSSAQSDDKLRHRKRASTLDTDYWWEVNTVQITGSSIQQDAEAMRQDIESGETTRPKGFALPLPAVLASASMGFLSFLSASGGNASQVQ